MEIEKLKEKTKEDKKKVLINARIPVEYKKFLEENKISPTVFIVESMKELIENAKKGGLD